MTMLADPQKIILNKAGFTPTLIGQREAGRYDFLYDFDGSDWKRPIGKVTFTQRSIVDNIVDSLVGYTITNIGRNSCNYLIVEQDPAEGVDRSTEVRYCRHLYDMWVSQRLTQGNDVASILRYTDEGGGNPIVGKESNKTLVANLASISVYKSIPVKVEWSDAGRIEIPSEFIYFTFETPVYNTDKISYDGVTYIVKEIITYSPEETRLYTAKCQRLP